MSQFYMICFDIADEKRLRKVAIQLENVGQRIQYSVFECFLASDDLNRLKRRLDEIIDPTADHIRYYGLCNRDRPKVRIDGDGSVLKNDDYHLL